MARTAIHCVIHGKVQGVWYRAWTEKIALSKSLDGWVRNLPDGTVEALFAGEETAVADMLAACRNGPPLSRVTDIDSIPADDPGSTGFSVR